MPRLASALLVLAIPAFALAQVPPEKAISTMKVADGLQIELFASEPMFANPTSIDVDHKGRVWICESVNYRHKLHHRPPNRPEGDRIVVLEDTDGDGKADKATTFYQAPDFLAPLGIAVAPYPDGKGCKVFVCHSPHIYVFEDRDGDLKADGPPKILLTGFGGFDHDHGVHGINIGPDGKLYFTVGDQGVKNLQSSDGKGRKWTTNQTDCQAGTVWRCNQDGTGLELIAHNFRNNYECCVNSFGEIWLSDNDDDGNQQTRICYVMPGGNYGYWPRGPGQSHWHEEQPGIVHKVLRTGFGSPTGICFYEGQLLPKKYWGQLLHCDAGPREFRCFHIKPKGAGYELEKELLVTSSDTWFRLSDVCVAPDGSVFLADWYDPGVGGHGMGDWTRGRIYRVTPKGHVGYKVPGVTIKSGEGLATALASPNQAVRALAHVVLSDERIADSVFQDVQDRALAEVKNAKGPAPKGVLYDRLGWIGGGKWTRPDILPLFVATWDGQKMSMYRTVALELRTTDISTVTPYFYALAKRYDCQDRFYRAALNIACGTDPERRAKILEDFDKHFPELNDKVLDLIWELRPPGAVVRLEKHLSDPGLKPEQRGRMVDVIASSDDPAAGKVLLRLVTVDSPPEVKERALEQLKQLLPRKWISLAKTDEFKAAVDQLLAKPQAAAGLRLAAAAKYTPALPQVAKLAAAYDKEAIRTLGKLPETQAVVDLGKILGELRVKSRGPMAPPLPVDVANAIIAAVGEQSAGKSNTQPAVVATYMLSVIVSSHDDPIEMKRAAVNALAGSQLGSEKLLELKHDGKLPDALVGDTGRLLRNSPFPELRKKAKEIFPATANKLDPKKLPTIAVLAKREGNIENGKKVMAESLKGEAQCLKCHTINGVGGQVGPDLSKIGAKASRENLIESILLPSKAIADQYIQWQIETKKGRQILGLIIEENADSILLRDANAKDYRIARSDIESRTKSPVSIMPESLVATLTEEELIDLVEYLLTLK
jgi:putative membrane-bound dehydrogenase-like protein